MQRQIENLLVGATLAFAASVLLPIANETLQTLTASGRKGAADLAGRTRSFLQLAREELEDIYAEAQFERIKRQLDTEIRLAGENI
jgi:secreted Zn-dependent insulinase-like peptidase